MLRIDAAALRDIHIQYTLPMAHITQHITPYYSRARLPQPHSVPRVVEVASSRGITRRDGPAVETAFTLVGAAQMAVWSRGKLKRYKRKFAGVDAFTATKALLPGIF